MPASNPPARDDDHRPGDDPVDTHASKGSRAGPRLPHERDQSSEGVSHEVDPTIKQAYDDVESGKTNTDRSEATEKLYDDVKPGSGGSQRTS